MYTLKQLKHLTLGKLFNAEGNENIIINDFEYLHKNIKNNNTALFVINEKNWNKTFSQKRREIPIEFLVPKNFKTAGLIITEEYIEYIDDNIPQLVVQNMVNAMFAIAKKSRLTFKNKLIAITGSVGKSSTRLMIKQVLKDYNVLENEHNFNTRPAVWLYMCKLCQNPDFAVVEVSLNALNERGNISLDLRPDVAVITPIGEAHLSTINNIQQIADFKSRLLDGLNDEGTAIISNTHDMSNYLINRARENNLNVITYGNEQSDIKLKEVKSFKGYSQITLESRNELVKFDLKQFGRDMIENVEAAYATVLSLDINSSAMNYLSDIKLFDKVLDTKKILNRNGVITILDDTHNASLPAMINAIETFNEQAKFYSGNKIIALGKINDLGKNSIDIHRKLIPVLNASRADYVFCLDQELRPVVMGVKGKVATWFRDSSVLKDHLKYFMNNNSYTLLKSSHGGTEFKSMATELIDELPSVENDAMRTVQHKIGIDGISHLLIEKNGDVLESLNVEDSKTIEGLSPLFYFIEAKERNITNYKVIDNKEDNGSIMFDDLLEKMRNKPSKQEIELLSSELFKDEVTRRKAINQFIDDNKLTKTAIVTVTGEFSINERQSFTVTDLLTIYKNYPYILNDNNTFIFGDQYNYGFRPFGNNIRVFISKEDY